MIEMSLSVLLMGALTVFCFGMLAGDVVLGGPEAKAEYHRGKAEGIDLIMTRLFGEGWRDMDEEDLREVDDGQH